ncbi:MAG: hypothetical protein HYX88_03745 [Chloroflexi bacterium]|nr:hypothetical protein [Chloroflexota bacterium]
MSNLRLGLLALAVGTFLASFVFFLPAPPRLGSGFFPSMGPGMMGRGMMGRGTGPGMMGGSLPEPRATPLPTPPVSTQATGDPMPGIVILVLSGSSLLGWWVLGRRPTLRPIPPEDPLEIAKRRYINGEISLPEYEEMAQTILQSNEAPTLKEAEIQRRRILP